MPAPVIVMVGATLLPKLLEFFKKHPWLIPIAVVVPLVAGFLIFTLIAGSLSGLQNISLPNPASFCNIAPTSSTDTPAPVTTPGAPKQQAISQDSIPSDLGFGGILQQCTPVYGDGTWVLPLKSWIVTAWYGMRIHPGSNKFLMHTGLDMGAAGGDPEYAVAAGTVTFVQNNNSSTGYGNYVIIDHGNGISSLYGHIMPGGVHVTVGETVQAGQEISQVGETGDATGNHLHFEIRKNGKTIDPMIFMMGQGVDLTGSRGILWSLVYEPTGLAYCTDKVYPWKFCSHFGL